MIKRIAHIATFFIVTIILLPPVITSVLLKRYSLDDKVTYSFVYPIYSPEHGLGFKIHGLNIKHRTSSSQSLTSYSLEIGSLVVIPNRGNLPVKHLKINDARFLENLEEILHHSTLSAHLRDTEIEIEGQFSSESIFGHEPVKFESTISSLLTNLSGTLILNIPNIDHPGYKVDFKPLNMSFNEKELWWDNQETFTLNQAQFVSKGNYKFKLNRLDFDFDVSSLDTRILPVTEELFTTTLAGQGEGFFEFIDGEANLRIDSKLTSGKGDFLVFNPEKTKDNINLIYNILDNLKEKKALDDIYPFDTSNIDLTYENGLLTVNKASFNRRRQSLIAKGHYDNENFYKFKIRYYKKSSPTPLSFAIKGQGDDYRVIIDPLDVINAFPDIILPPLDKIIN